MRQKGDGPATILRQAANAVDRRGPSRSRPLRISPYRRNDGGRSLAEVDGLTEHVSPHISQMSPWERVVIGKKRHAFEPQYAEHHSW